MKSWNFYLKKIGNSKKKKKKKRDKFRLVPNLLLDYKKRKKKERPREFQIAPLVPNYLEALTNLVHVPFRAYPGFMQPRINPKDNNESLLWYNLCDFKIITIFMNFWITQLGFMSNVNAHTETGSKLT